MSNSFCAKPYGIRTQPCEAAYPYLRTSSAANVGSDKDSDERQRAAIAAYAKRAGYRIVCEFYDAAVSGADSINARPGFAAMLERIAGNGVRTIIVETANRFARDLIVQETGHKQLCALGVELIAADSPDAFVHDTPTAKLVRQVLGAVAEFEKAALVAKLKVARDRKREATGWCGGQRPHSQLRPEAVALAKRLHRGKRRSLRKIAAALAAAGYFNENGRPFAAASVKSVKQDRQRRPAHYVKPFKAKSDIAVGMLTDCGPRRSQNYPHQLDKERITERALPRRCRGHSRSSARTSSR